MTAGARCAVFLDRDGVLNEPVITDGTPKSPMRLDDVRLIDGATEACHELHDAGLLLFVITNQPEVARGRVARSAVDAINQTVVRDLPVDAVYVCPHDDADACECRKPKPGLILRAAAEWDVDLSCSYVVGDRWRDIEAGRRAGCATIFIDYGYSEQRPDGYDLAGRDLQDVASWIVTRHARGSVA